METAVKPKKKTKKKAEAGIDANYVSLPDPKENIIIRGAKVNNLKNVDIDVPKYNLVVFTGVSGSGKSSLVFDTIYAEGQRRYVESLSSYARQFLERMNKPDVDLMLGLAPAVAIEQKTTTRNPRSTVGTSTEIYDYLRLLFARIGRIHSPVTGEIVERDSPDVIIKKMAEAAKGKSLRMYIFYKIEIKNNSAIPAEIADLRSKGFYRMLIGNELLDVNEQDENDIAKKLAKAGEINVVVDRIAFDMQDNESVSRLNDAIEMSYREGNGYVTIRTIEGDKYIDYDFNRYLEADGMRFDEPEPRLFSFNNPYGACPKCQGFGNTMDIDIDLIIPNKKKSLHEGAIAPFQTPKHSKHQNDLLREARKRNIDVFAPFSKLPQKDIDYVMNGSTGYLGVWGFFKMIEREGMYKMHYRILLNKYRSYTTCNTCKGSRLRKEALYVRIAGKTIHDIIRMKIDECYEFFLNIGLSEYDKKVSERIMEEIVSRLRYLNDVGLTYLSLDRLSNTLSGGESQRINLSTSLGSSLVGSIYVLDEPSIGLHPRDNQKLINIMKRLRDLGNTVLVVEHDEDMMESADQIVDMGPFAGELGGKVIFQGTYNKILKDKESLTGKYLSGRAKIKIPKVRKTPDSKTKFIEIKGARENNLKDVNVKIPLSSFVCITGVSGSGKSTLINDILYGGLKKKLEGSYADKIGEHDEIKGHENIDAIEIVDQSPIGRTPRSNPVTYIKAFDVIREQFADTVTAKKKNLSPGYFSFNVPGGRCETCEGTGIIKVEMQFMADIALECESCGGKRYKQDVLDIKLKGGDETYKNISEVLGITVSEALKFFEPYPKVIKKLKVLEDVGLGYIRLGQSGSTLSGGESQRVKLAYHLTFQEKDMKTLFIFDEPTTGLHFYDTDKLLKSFNELIKKGNSVVVIEHNLDVIKSADHIIDLGPESGDEGGEIIAAGTPEEIAANKKSYTGKYLKKFLDKA